MNTPMMKCGHAANATQGGKPACAICAGTPESVTVAATPSLEGRIARCAYCKKTAPSSTSLAYFGYQPDKAEDSFYDGCFGWD